MNSAAPEPLSLAWERQEMRRAWARDAARLSGLPPPESPCPPPPARPFLADPPSPASAPTPPPPPAAAGDGDCEPAQPPACLCGCGQPVVTGARTGGAKLYATGSCRVRAKRARDRQAAEPGAPAARAAGAPCSGPLRLAGHLKRADLRRGRGEKQDRLATKFARRVDLNGSLTLSALAPSDESD